jgi:hypothetical protein
MKITDYSTKDLSNWVITEGTLVCPFNKVVMESEMNLFLYNTGYPNDTYVGLIDHNGITEALERMHELGINVIDGRVKAND